jgi:hypothetical protein
VNLPGKPEDELIGVMSSGPFGVNGDILIGETSARLFQNANVRSGDTLPGLLGYEVARMFGHAPTNTVRLCHSPYLGRGGAKLYSDVTMYQMANGAVVFATGTMQWNWGLSDISPLGSPSSVVNPAAQQITRDVLSSFLSR